MACLERKLQMMLGYSREGVLSKVALGGCGGAWVRCLTCHPRAVARRTDVELRFGHRQPGKCVSLGLYARDCQDRCRSDHGYEDGNAPPSRQKSARCTPASQINTHRYQINVSASLRRWAV